MRSTDELIENFYGIIDALEARLTLTEAALSAAGELLRMSYADMRVKYDGIVSYPVCDYCESGGYEHKETCPYHQARVQWDAARDALK